MGIEQIQFDNDAVPLRSDLRVLATIRFRGEPVHSIYLDSNGSKEGIKRSDYISATLEPQLFKQDEVSVVSNWPRYGGPNIVVLPEGQRLLLGQLAEGVTVDVALWRRFIMAQTFSNRILVAATDTGIAAFQPRPGTAVTPRAESIYKDSKQQKNVQNILNSISEVPKNLANPGVAAVSDPPPHLEASTESEDLKINFEEIHHEIIVESFPDPHPETFKLNKPVVTSASIIDSVVINPNEVRPRKSAKILNAISDLFITFAIFAIMFAAHQTVWSTYVSQSHIAEARAEVQLKWIEAPAIEPELHKGFALIFIPRLRDKVWELPITRGVDAEDLISGLGHYPDSALPGEKGNFAMAGLRTTYGEPLAGIDQLKRDDEVIIQTAGNWYVYKLVLAEIVEPDALWVLEENPNGIVTNSGVGEIITVTTSHPSWGSTHRWIWWGVLTEVRPYDQVPDSIAAMQESQVE